MTPITASELRSVCRDADADAVAGFVAALYEARGRAVERESGPAFSLGGPGDRERIVVPTDGTVPRGADAVVVAGRAIDPGAAGAARRIDADRLHSALLYAIPRERADQLLERWFDRPLSSFDGTGTDGGQHATGDGPSGRRATGEDATAVESGAVNTETGGGAGTTTDDPTRPANEEGASGARSGSGRPGPDAAAVDAGGGGDGTGPRTSRRPARIGAVAGLIVLVALAGWAAGGTPGFGPGSGIDADPNPEVTTGAGSLTATSVGTGAPTATAETPTGERRTGGSETTETADTTKMTAEAPVLASESIGKPFPPGVDSSGITDYRHLVAVHSSELHDSSYRVTLVYREFVDGEATGVFTQTVWVENATRYRASSFWFGQFASNPPRLVETDVFADGSTRFVKTPAGITREPTIGTDLVGERLSRYLGYYLSVSESAVVDRETRGTGSVVLLSLRNDPWPGVRNMTGAALVSESGIVRSVRREYVDADTGVYAVATIRVSEVNQTTAHPPSWLDEE